MLTINIPNNFIPERTYIIDVLFGEFLDLEYRIIYKDNINEYKIVLENNNELIIKDSFFSNFNDSLQYLNEDYFPDRARYAKNEFLIENDIPIIYGNDELIVKQNKIKCSIDVFASSFMMLTRWEEFVLKIRDAHDRFPASASIAYKHGFLSRPVVNEYQEMIWNMLCSLGYKRKRKKREFKIMVSHDVDVPFFYAFKSMPSAIKLMIGDLLKRKSPYLAFNNFCDWFKVGLGDLTRDKYNTFGKIMDISDSRDLKSTFYFITDRNNLLFDGNYDIEHPHIKSLINNINRRGHNIGLHLGYDSFRNPDQTKKEFNILRTVCAGEGIEKESWSSRQHYLRWDSPRTFENLEQAGIDVDTTLSYADMSGFRCGVCYEYSVFNVLTRKRLKLKERPLLIMESSVIDDYYMNLGTEEKAFLFMKNIKDKCKTVKGDFTLLWHNTRFLDDKERKLYNEILGA